MTPAVTRDADSCTREGTDSMGTKSLLTPTEAAHTLRISRAKLYQLLYSGEFDR